MFIKTDMALEKRGRATVAIDQPLKRDINELAAADGKTAAEFLRELIAEKKMQNPQGVIPKLAVKKDISQTLADIDGKLNAIVENSIISSIMWFAENFNCPPEKSAVHLMANDLRKLSSSSRAALKKALAAADAGDQSEFAIK